MPNEPTFLIWTLVFIIAVLLVVIVLVSVSLGQIKREFRSLNRTLDKLEARVGEQERQMAQVRSALERRGGGDLFAPIVEAVRALRSRGALSALTLIGSHLFRSYLGRRRQKSLPDDRAT